MGRYDKIKYFDGFELKKPSQIKIYDGSNFIDYGENESNNVNNFYNYADNRFKKTLLSKSGEKTISGLIHGTASERWGISNSYYTPTIFDFEATFKSSYSFQEYSLLSATKTPSDTRGLYFVVYSGVVRIKIVTSSTTITLPTSASVPLDNNWHKIKISVSHRSSNRMLTAKTTIDDGEETTNTFSVTSWNVQESSYLVIGHDSVKFKDTIRIIGYSSNSGAVTTEIPISELEVGEKINLPFSNPLSVVTSVNQIENSEIWE